MLRASPERPRWPTTPACASIFCTVHRACTPRDTPDDTATTPPTTPNCCVELDGVADAQRGAFFICVLALLRHADDPAPLIVEGRWHGRVLHATRGTQGFGYDPLFLPDGQTVSSAELEPALRTGSATADRRRGHCGKLVARRLARSC